jgi:hypothetical protein
MQASKKAMDGYLRNVAVQKEPTTGELSNEEEGERKTFHWLKKTNLETYLNPPSQNNNESIETITP